MLRRRLVAIYRSDEPDVLTVMLESDGFDDLISRYEYLRRIEEQDADIVGRVRGLRNDSRDTVARIEAARDEIAAKKAELERTRIQLEAREAELDAVRDQKAVALDEVHSDIERLEGDRVFKTTNASCFAFRLARPARRPTARSKTIAIIWKRSTIVWCAPATSMKTC